MEVLTLTWLKNWPSMPPDFISFSEYMHTCDPLHVIRTPLLPKNLVLIREVSFGEREHHMHAFTVVAAKNLCPL